MVIVILWIALTGIVAAAADARGRSGAGWFFIALFFSPLVGILLLLVSPNLKQQRLLEAAVGTRRQPPPLPQASLFGRADRVTIDRTPKPFEPDGVYAGIPYKVADDGSIQAIMQGAMVQFRDFERFTGALGAS